jgi:hypothetical protein
MAPSGRFGTGSQALKTRPQKRHLKRCGWSSDPYPFFSARDRRKTSWHSLPAICLPSGPSPAAAAKGEGLIATSCKLQCSPATLERELYRFRLPAGGSGDAHQALGCEDGQAMAEVALIGAEGVHHVLVAG